MNANTIDPPTLAERSQPTPVIENFYLSKLNHKKSNGYKPTGTNRSTLVNKPLYPTAAQALTCFVRCQVTTCTFLLPVHIVRLDERDETIYILAGDDLGIVIFRNGDWEFEE